MSHQLPLGPLFLSVICGNLSFNELVRRKLRPNETDLACQTNYGTKRNAKTTGLQLTQAREYYRRWWLCILEATPAWKHRNQELQVLVIPPNEWRTFGTQKFSLTLFLILRWTLRWIMYQQRTRSQVYLKILEVLISFSNLSLYLVTVCTRKNIAKGYEQASN